jgi:hypothetical protein
MRYLIICFCLFIALPIASLSQDNRFTIRSGVGYYMDILSMDDGPTIWIEGGYTLKTDFTINTRVSMASIDWVINDGVFKDYQTIQLRQMVDFTISKPIKLKGQHFLEPGFGFKLKKEYLLKPSVSNIYSGGSYYQSTSYSDIFWEIGFTLCIDYYYQFESNFYLGLRADSNVIWALGFEGLSVTPIFGFRF